MESYVIFGICRFKRFGANFSEKALCFKEYPQALLMSIEMNKEPEPYISEQFFSFLLHVIMNTAIK